MPKGTPPEGAEDIDEALGAVLLEKINAEGEVGELIGENEYRAGENKKSVTKKDIHYYLFEVSNPDEIKLNKERKGLNNLKWFSVKNFKKVDKYDDMAEILESGLEKILAMKK